MLRTHPNNLDSKAIREQVIETLIDVMRTADERTIDGEIVKNALAKAGGAE